MMKKTILSLLLACSMMTTILAGCGGKQPAETTAAAQEAHKDGDVVANGQKVYRIIVSDADGKPIEAASVQFCSDITCTLQPTGADGTASFEAAPGKYTVHVLKAPEGYAKNDTEYVLLEEPCDLYVQLASDK